MRAGASIHRMAHFTVLTAESKGVVQKRAAQGPFPPRLREAATQPSSPDELAGSRPLPSTTISFTDKMLGGP